LRNVEHYHRNIIKRISSLRAERTSYEIVSLKYVLNSNSLTKDNNLGFYISTKIAG